jgi:hypothetical protein
LVARRAPSETGTFASKFERDEEAAQKAASFISEAEPRDHSCRVVYS